MAAVSAELPIGRVFEIAGPLATARCTSVCRTWREAAEISHVWRVHVETTCGRAVATAVEELQRQGRTSLTFQELIIKRWRSNYITAASGYTWTQVAPYRADSTQDERNERKEQLAERFRVVLLEASLVHRQTGSRMAFVTVPLDETHIRRLFARSGLPPGTSGLPFPTVALSEVESINECSIVFTLYDLCEAHVAKIMTAHFEEPAGIADNGIRNFVSYDLNTVMCDMPWPEGADTGSGPSAAAELKRDLPGDHTLEIMTETLIDAMIESIMEDPTIHDATLRLHPVLVVVEDPPSMRLRFQFMYWEDEGDSVVQDFSTAQVRRLLDRLLVEQAVWV